MIIGDNKMEELYVTQGSISRKISINPDFSEDPFYRYKVHQLIIETTKGKTILINIDNVAQELKVDPMYIIRYFGSYLGTQVKYNNRKATLSGTFSVTKLSQLLVQFIQEMVLCKNCGLPELDYLITKDKVILICRSCGTNDNLSSRNVPISLQKYIKLRPYQ